MYSHDFHGCSMVFLQSPGLQLRLRAAAEGRAGPAGDQTRLPQRGGRGGTRRLLPDETMGISYGDFPWKMVIYSRFTH